MMSKDDSAMDLDDELVISRVGAWRNKAEFDLVYDWLYAASACSETKRLALSRLKLWKTRRGNLTPASILSTLCILEVQLKDDESNPQLADSEIRSMYSNAFIRLVNYMSSIMRSRQLQSMYSTARELGMEPFLVDLRHLCAHGHVLPTLEIFRRTADYCMQWLRDFYWERERNFITDATVSDVHLKSATELEQSIVEWFELYDAATEAVIRGNRNVEDLITGKQSERLSVASIQRLQQFGQQIHQNKLSFIANRAINQLAQLSNSNERDRSNGQIYCDVLFKCEYFMKRSAEYSATTNKEEKIKFIGIHQNLFRMFAICDFINVVFMRLVTLCEDELEDEYIRHAASYWANEIATGFLVFKEFKVLYKSKKENNAKFNVDLAPINTDIMTDDIKNIYKELGVNCRGILIFGDTVRRPWSLQFDRGFLIERSMCINERTVDIVKKCIQLIEPALSKQEVKHIEQLISIYMRQVSVGKSEAGHSPDIDVVHTFEDCIQSNTTKSIDLPNEQNEGSIWREAPEGLNWKSCPIGSLP